MYISILIGNKDSKFLEECEKYFLLKNVRLIVTRLCTPIEHA